MPINQDQLNDLKFLALGNLGQTEETTPERWLSWLLLQGATTPQQQDAETEFLNIQGVPQDENINNRWFFWLGAIGYTQPDLMQRWWYYWQGGGGGVTPPENNLVDEFGEDIVDELGNNILV